MNTRRIIDTKKERKEPPPKKHITKFKLNKSTIQKKNNVYKLVDELYEYNDNNKDTKYDIDKSNKVPMFSGTIIYDGQYPLNPYSWKPSDPSNNIDYLDWSNVTVGCQILDKNTQILWIINEGNKLSIAPCQTIKLDIGVPPSLDNFNPSNSTNPFLPTISNIPIGTIFVFKNSSQRFKLNQKYILEICNNIGRPPMVIPIAVNSLYNTQSLIGLNKPIFASSLQRPAPEGYNTLEEWLCGLVIGNTTKVGIVSALPVVSDLQPFDILDFFDPSIGKNPHQNGFNGDGTVYIEDYNESNKFIFKLQVLMNSKNILIGKEISNSEKPKMVNVIVPYEKTDLDESIYIRSICIVPNKGDIITILSEIDKPYRLPLHIERFISDTNTKLLSLGGLYKNIIMSYTGKNKIQKSYTFTFTGINNDINGIVLSSDSIPYNKFCGSGRLFIGHTTQNYNNGNIYVGKLDVLDDIIIEDVCVDGISIFENVENIEYSFSNNKSIHDFLKLINIKMNLIGEKYQGYVLNLWYNDNVIYFLLNGIKDNMVPSIIFKINDKINTLIFNVY